jgi:hypothetical protein
MDHVVLNITAVAWWNLATSLFLWVATFSPHVSSWPIVARLGFVLVSCSMMMESVLYLVTGKLSILGIPVYQIEHLGLSLIGSSLCLGIIWQKYSLGKKWHRLMSDPLGLQ